MEALQFPLYISTKAALASFIRCMGDLEGMHGIRVTGVLPGIVSTLLSHKSFVLARKVEHNTSMLLRTLTSRGAIFITVQSRILNMAAKLTECELGQNTFVARKSRQA